MSTPRYLRFAQALALVSATSGVGVGCNSGSQPCELAGQPCRSTDPRPGCCFCVPTALDAGEPAPDGGEPATGVWGGGCGGPLAPPSLDVA